MEEAWRSRKLEDGLEEKGRLEDESMDWEELAVDSWRTYLGLGDNKELEEMEVDLEEEEDWLDRWLEDDMESGQEEQEEVRGDLLRLSLDDHRDMDMEMEYETDYMAWLEKELQEIGIGEDILECIRTMACDGDCKDKCWLETKRYEDIGPAREIEDCVRSVHCIGNCQDKCSVETANNEDNRYGSIVQPSLDSRLANDMSRPLHKGKQW